jgi:nucleoside-diphosphate-sugar epimerase
MTAHPMEKRYKSKKVLVTGGTGFIGCRLAERLVLEEGAEVKVLVNRWFKAVSVSRSNVQLIQGNIVDLETVDAAVKGCDVVFHCVGVGGDRRYCMEVNVNGTRNVLQACQKYGVERVVYLSTVGVHGPCIEEGMNETAPFRMLGTPYGDSKIQAEEVCRQFMQGNRLQISIVRPTYVWGPNSPWFTLDPVQKIKQGSFFVVDGGNGVCNAVHVDNVVDLSLLAGIDKRAIGEAFLIRDAQQITWGDFFMYYARMVGKDRGTFLSVSSVPSNVCKAIKKPVQLSFIAVSTLHNWIGSRFTGNKYKLVRAPFSISARATSKLVGLINVLFPEPYSWWDLQKFNSPGFIDISKANKLLGYHPRILIDEGMRETENWLRDQNHI